MKWKVKHRSPYWIRHRYPDYKWMAAQVDKHGRPRQGTIRRFVTWSEAMAYVDEKVRP